MSVNKLRVLVRDIMLEDSVDIHTKTASNIFGVSCSEITEEQRECAKLYNIGRSYNFNIYHILSFFNKRAIK